MHDVFQVIEWLRLQQGNRTRQSAPLPHLLRNNILLPWIDGHHLLRLRLLLVWWRNLPIHIRWGLLVRWRHHLPLRRTLLRPRHALWDTWRRCPRIPVLLRDRWRDRVAVLVDELHSRLRLPLLWGHRWRCASTGVRHPTAHISLLRHGVMHRRHTHVRRTLTVARGCRHRLLRRAPSA